MTSRPRRRSFPPGRRAFDSWGHLGGNGNSATIANNIGGFILGADATLYGRYRLGVAGGYTNSNSRRRRAVPPGTSQRPISGSTAAPASMRCNCAAAPSTPTIIMASIARCRSPASTRRRDRATAATRRGLRRGRLADRRRGAVGLGRVGRAVRRRWPGSISIPRASPRRPGPPRSSAGRRARATGSRRSACGRSDDVRQRAHDAERHDRLAARLRRRRRRTRQWLSPALP